MAVPRVTSLPLGKVIFALILIIALGRVAAGHRILSTVIDEPVHIAAGYEWLLGDPYTLDPTHPPLARILSALPLWLEGLPRPTAGDFVSRGNQLLYHDDQFVRHLQRARWGNLVLLLVGLAGTGALALRVFDPPTGLVAAAVFGSVPAVLGHAGVATTDLAVAAMLPLALFALDRWLEEVTGRRAIALGICTGFGLLAKFSFAPFFAVTAGTLVCVRSFQLRGTTGTRPSQAPTVYLRGAFIALVVAGVVVWGGYRFDFGTIAGAGPSGMVVVERLAPDATRAPALWAARHVPIPAPAFFAGVGLVALHNREGHLAYLLGEYRQRGWWYYFPVVLFYKTPLALLLLFGWGGLLLVGEVVQRPRMRGIEILLMTVALVALVLPSSINIGVRHVLPVYATASILVAHAIVKTWRATTHDAFGRVCLIALTAWYGLAGALAHPGYIAYFNEAAGEHPERILTDSNLDWGQDMLRLVRFARRHNIESLMIVHVGNLDLGRHGLNATPLQPYAHASGWVAISETALRLAGGERDRGEPYRWIEVYRPVARIGRTIRIYRIP